MGMLTFNNGGCNEIIAYEGKTCAEVCKEHQCESCPIAEAIDRFAAYERSEERERD